MLNHGTTGTILTSFGITRSLTGDWNFPHSTTR